MAIEPEQELTKTFQDINRLQRGNLNPAEAVQFWAAFALENVGLATAAGLVDPLGRREVRVRRLITGKIDDEYALDDLSWTKLRFLGEAFKWKVSARRMGMRDYPISVYSRSITIADAADGQEKVRIVPGQKPLFLINRGRVVPFFDYNIGTMTEVNPRYIIDPSSHPTEIFPKDLAEVPITYPVLRLVGTY